MKDRKLKTSFENYEAFDHIAGSSYGSWTDRKTAVAMVDFLNGSINTHCRHDSLMREVAETSDDNLGELLGELMTELSEVIDDDQWHYIAWRDNEATVLPAVESCLEDHRNDNRLSEDLPEADSTHHCGETWMTVNDHGNASLYRFVDTVTGWQEIWAVV